ncbi:DUF6011 domain-containing protein [Nocardia cyriacigeorgica]|uniref:DUF6011 domain-containing protein n=1 Tax=Nocardia cyriacigeorgica TaxID=135487 RepID=UPI00313EAC9A
MPTLSATSPRHPCDREVRALPRPRPIARGGPHEPSARTARQHARPAHRTPPESKRRVGLYRSRDHHTVGHRQHRRRIRAAQSRQRPLVSPFGNTARLDRERRCHGWLLSAASVRAGIGPTCAARERAEQRAAATVPLTLFDVAA